MSNNTLGSKQFDSGDRHTAPDGRNTENPVVGPDQIARLRSGDHEAFKNIFTLYYNKVKYFIRSMIVSEEEAEDITQDIFISVWQNRERIDSHKNFNGYIFTLAKNAVFDNYRKKLVRDAYVSASWGPDISFDTEEVLNAKELELLVSMAVSRMPKQRKRIFKMSRHDGLTNEEIARELGLSKGAVEKQITLALKDIRNIITAFIILAGIFQA